MWEIIYRLFRREQEPEQGTHNTISLKCFLCQGNWTGTNIEALTDHLEKDHKVVFKIKELIELSKPEELEPTTTTEEEERLLTVSSETSVDTKSGESMNSFWKIRQLITFLDSLGLIYSYFSYLRST